ncbi:MAG: WD40/YVTN/BNR-like repeat-containing protein [Gemmatimonadales bacterium]
MRTSIRLLVGLGFGAILALHEGVAQTAVPAGKSPGGLADLRFRMVGPSRGGRVTAVAGVAEAPATFYMGSTGGGVWKSSNSGNSWTNISDGYFATASIGAIDVADSDPNTIYVGTGSDGIRSNVITGKGVYKSTDAGKTWRFVGLKDVGQIGAVVVHPSNPNDVTVAAIGHAFGPSAERGVYRSRDGGDTWRKTLFVSDSTGAADLELAPDNPREMYATMWRAERKPWTIISGAREGGVYKSVDGGETWSKLTSGLPSGLIGKGDLAVSAADPNRVYLLLEAPVGEGGVYRSDDRGASWRLVSTQASLLDRPFYYTNIDADPTNADRVFVNSTAFFMSTDAGKTWQRRPVPHGDNHDMWINPKNPKIWIQANDGGVNVTQDDGHSWSTQLNQPTAELYQVAVDDRTPYWIYAGQQDNSTIGVPSLPPATWTPDQPAGWWKQIGGCETGPAIPKPGDPDVFYSNCKGQFSRYNDRTGQEQIYWVGARDLYGHNPKDLRDRFQRVVPIHVSPHSARTVYHASQYLYRTMDEGKTWVRISPDLTANDPRGQVPSGTPITRDITGEEYYSTIYAVQESKLEPGAILVGANDGPVHLTRNAGLTWQKVTPSDLPAGGRVQAVEWSPHRRGKAYFAAYRYLLGDWRPYLYRTTDHGKSWTLLTTGTNGIPADYPTRVVREDPSREGLLYAGTEFGLFVSFDDGGTWQPFQQNLPVTPVTDLVVHRKDLVVATMGRSFWVLDELSPLHQLANRAEGAAAHLFAPREAVRLRHAGGSLFGIGAAGRDPSDPEHPAPGMWFDYWLATEPADATLDVLDRTGRLLRRFSSTAAGEKDQLPADPGMRRFALERVGTPRLPKTAGHHRFHWDFALPGPWHANPDQSGRNGPWVVPGAYQVRLTVGEWSQTRPVRIAPDPRVVRDGVTQLDLEHQLRTALAARDLVSDVRALAREVADLRKQGDTPALQALAAKLTAEPTRYPMPKLVEQTGFLYRMTLQADQRLGKDVTDRLVELTGQIAAARSELAAARP